MSFSHYLALANPLFLTMKVLPLKKLFFYKVGLIMYKYFLNFLPNCIQHNYIYEMIVSMSIILEDVIHSEYYLVQRLSLT